MSWYSWQAAPASASKVMTVPLAVPVMRQVARIELPSTSAAKTPALRSALNLFILTIILERARYATPAATSECLPGDTQIDLSVNFEKGLLDMTSRRECFVEHATEALPVMGNLHQRGPSY